MNSINIVTRVRSDKYNHHLYDVYNLSTYAQVEIFEKLVASNNFCYISRAKFVNKITCTIGILSDIYCDDDANYLLVSVDLFVKRRYDAYYDIELEYLYVNHTSAKFKNVSITLDCSYYTIHESLEYIVRNIEEFLL